jgi:epoxide hydrolase-like predicted phosphatase
VRAVIVDIGAVLEYTPPTGHTAAWEAELGLEAGELDRRMLDVWRGGSIGTITEDDVHAALVERLGLSPADRDRFMAGVWEEYLGTLNAELAEWFAGLRPRYRTGIVSNSFVGARERERERYGFEDLTDTIVYSHEVGVAKPDPVIYLMACERLGVRPEEAVFLDDREPAIEGARAVGMSAVLFRDNAQAIGEIEKLLAG